MKEVVNSFVQLAAMIMILITLAVSTAAVAQWVDTDAATQNDGRVTQPMLASDASR
ncbi:MAG: hypothetical protein ACRD68_09650 [Pyrinomonadaceae bacterium]